MRSTFVSSEKAPLTPAQSEVLLSIFAAGASLTGDDFFAATTLAIGASLKVRVVFVSELLLEIDRARAVAVCVDGSLGRPAEFTLHGTPLEEVVFNQSVVSHDNGSAVSHDVVRLEFLQQPSLSDVTSEVFIALLLRAASGDPIGVLGLAHDTALSDQGTAFAVLSELKGRVSVELERRQRENAIRRNEALFRRLAERSKDVLFYWQTVPVARLAYVNPAIEDLLGIPPEAVEANPDVALQHIHPDDRDSYVAATTSATEEPVLTRVLADDGKIRWLECRSFAVHDQDGTVVAIAGSAHDVTSRVRAEEDARISEQAMRTLFEKSPDAVLRLGPDARILDYVASEDFPQLPLPKTDVIGRGIRELLPSWLAGRVQPLVRTALSTGRFQRTTFEVEHEGAARFYEASCIPFENREAILILRDFTLSRWHEAEEERRQIREELDSKVERRILGNPYGLTYRELAILHLVAAGSADKQIAELLGISTYTVNKHVGNILGKMNASSRTEAGVRSIREGLVS